MKRKRGPDLSRVDLFADWDEIGILFCGSRYAMVRHNLSVMRRRHVIRTLIKGMKGAVKAGRVCTEPVAPKKQSGDPDEQPE